MTLAASSDATALEANRVRLITELERRILEFEARYELPSRQLEDHLRRGELRETAEVAHWVLAIRALKALRREGGPASLEQLG